MRYVKIPKDRVAILIGREGKTKEKIEEYGVNLEIDSSTGDVKIVADESIKEMDAENVVRAIGRSSPGKMADAC